MRIARGLIGWVIVWSLLVLSSTAQGASQQPYLQSLRALSQHAKVTALVVRLDDMKPIAQIHPDQQLTPASVSKLFAASAALEQFGPAHRFVSRFVSDANHAGGTLNGNLIFVGGGDPSLDERQLWALIARLRNAGIDHVKGDLIVDNGLFGTVPCLTKDRCDARTRAAHSYSAPLSAVGVNFATVHASVYGGPRADDPTRAVLHPRGLSGYRIDNQASTGLYNSRPRLAAWRTFQNGVSTLHLRGQIPAGGGPYEVHRAVAGPANDAARILARMLRDSGIEVDGQARAVTGSGEGLDTLARIESTTLAEQLIPMLAYSNNYMADTLTLDLAADSQYNKPLSLPRASQSLEALAGRTIRHVFPSKANGKGPIFDSGSGLAVSNKLSARDLVSLLAYMYRQDALFPSFYGAIPVPLSAPSSTLKHGNLDWLTRIVAKTGTLTEPVTVRALAGYFRLQRGGFGAFAFIINGTKRRPALTFHQTVSAYQNDMEQILADY